MPSHDEVNQVIESIYGSTTPELRAQIRVWESHIDFNRYRSRAGLTSGLHILASIIIGFVGYQFNPIGFMVAVPTFIWLRISDQLRLQHLAQLYWGSMANYEQIRSTRAKS